MGKHKGESFMSILQFSGNLRKIPMGQIKAALPGIIQKGRAVIQHGEDILQISIKDGKNASQLQGFFGRTKTLMSVRLDKAKALFNERLAKFIPSRFRPKVGGEAAYTQLDMLKS